jgi:hypothetical protein
MPVKTKKPTTTTSKKKAKGNNNNNNKSTPQQVLPINYNNAKNDDSVVFEDANFDGLCEMTLHPLQEKDCGASISAKRTAVNGCWNQYPVVDSNTNWYLYVYPSGITMGNGRRMVLVFFGRAPNLLDCYIVDGPQKKDVVKPNIPWEEYVLPCLADFIASVQKRPSAIVCCPLWMNTFRPRQAAKLATDLSLSLKHKVKVVTAPTEELAEHVRGSIVGGEIFGRKDRATFETRHVLQTRRVF